MGFAFTGAGTADWKMVSVNGDADGAVARANTGGATTPVLTTWQTLKVAINLCRDRLRTVWWKRVVPLDGGPLRARRPDPESAADAMSRDRLIRKALDGLPPMYREALALYHLEDLPYREISEITGVAVPALKQRVRRGSAMLRKKIVELYPELKLSRIH